MVKKKVESEYRCHPVSERAQVGSDVWFLKFISYLMRKIFVSKIIKIKLANLCSGQNCKALSF